MHQLLQQVLSKGTAYLSQIANRSVAPSPEAIARLSHFDFPLQEEPIDPGDVLAELDDYGAAASVTSAGPRYFGFVTGGSLPAALAANLLAGIWDQNAALDVASPVAAKIETVCRRWLVDIMGFPPETGIGFVTGATMANFTGLAAARHALLANAGWDVEAQGLFGAPEINLVVGEEVHVSLLKAVSMLGLGRGRLVHVRVDSQGRMMANEMPPLTERSIVCVQAGNVNTGSFDPADQIIPRAHEAGAWVHVDGAFGLWAAASETKQHLLRGFNQADSWATDAHKWLNVPYDSGLVFVRDALKLKGAMSTSAAYLIEEGQREPSHYVPELSRRARGFEIWAALRSLGKAGLSDMVDRCCDYAHRFAHGLSAAGYEVLNEVVLNQVLVSFGSAEQTLKVIKAVQQDGTCWAGRTKWQGHTAMRISVSSWATNTADVEISLQAIVRAADAICR